MKKNNSIKIIIGENCGNSPRQNLLKEFNIAFVEHNMDFILSCVSDEIIWDIVGDKKISGISDFKNELNNMNETTTLELKIEKIITHGKIAAVEGIMTIQNGETYKFCDTYIFEGFSKTAKIKSLTSFVIQVKV